MGIRPRTAVIDRRPELRDALFSGDPQRRDRAQEAVSANIATRVGELLGAVHHLWANRHVVGADATKHATTIRTYGHFGAQQQQLWAPIALCPRGAVELKRPRRTARGRRARRGPAAANFH